MPNVTQKMKELEDNCPEGYEVAIPGQSIDMLGKKELWLIYSDHSKPHLTRIPQGLVDFSGAPCAARVPKEWGHPLYYKVL